MAHRMLVGAIGVVLWACNPEMESIRAPDLSGYASLLIAAQTSGVLAVEAHALPMTENFRIEAPAGDGIDLRLLAYTSSLAALGYAEGPLPLDARGDVLPRPDHIFRAPPGPASSAWSEESSLVEPLASARFAPRSFPCAELERLTLTLPSTSSVQALLPIDDQAVLAALLSGEILLVSPGGVTRRSDLETRADVVGGARAEDGSIWIADDEGGISRIAPDLSARDPISGVRFSHRTNSLIVRSGPPLEIYSLDEASDLQRSDGTRTQRLGRAGRDGVEGYGRHAIWAAPGQLWLVDRGEEVWSIRGDTVTSFFPEWSAADSRPGLGALTLVDQIGPVAVGNHSVLGTILFRRDANGTWTELYGPENEHLFWPVWIAEDLGEGQLLLAGQQGFAAVLRLASGVCRELAPGPRHWNFAARAGRDVVLAGSLIVSSDVPTSVVWLRRQ
ncbi:MAG: hypothetical protein IT384_14135 [Deltaproteobacteria bacterium]|nr:hypothetical protein [Deltaproteobacteria bacterium]